MCDLQSHSSRCTEYFYKTHIDENSPFSENLRSQIKQKTLEVLRREGNVASNSTEEEEEGEENDGEVDFELSDKIVNLALSDNLDINDLSPQERRQFRVALTNGKLSSYFPEWKPWWKRTEKEHNRIVHQKLGRTFIQQLDDDENQGTGHSEDFSKALTTQNANVDEEEPTKPEEKRQAEQILEEVKQDWVSERITPSLKCCKDRIPLLSELFTGDPSPELVNDVANILLSYCHTIRTCYGDKESNLEEAGHILFQTCAVLKHKQHFPSLEASINEATVLMAHVDHTVGRQTNLRTTHMLLSDVQDILSSPVFICDAIWDCYDTIHRSRRMLKRKKSESSDEGMRKNIFTSDSEFGAGWMEQKYDEQARFYKEAERKLWFILSYVSETSLTISMQRLKDGIEYYRRRYNDSLNDMSTHSYENIVSHNAASQVPFVSTVDSSQNHRIGDREKTNLSGLD